MFKHLSEEEVVVFFEKSKSVSNFCNNAGITGINGNVLKEAREFLLERGLRYKSAKEKYLENPKKCRYCNKTIPYEKRGNSFCGSSCSATFYNLGSKASEEQKKKTSKTLIERNKRIKKEQGWTKKDNKWAKKKNDDFLKKKYSENCLICNKKIDKKNKTKLCQHCLRNSKYGKELTSKRTKKLMEEGKIKGWTSRNILSYPEEFWLKVLNNNNIYIDKPNKYFRPYFLDFWIEKNGIKIDLEIDGKQHDLEERKESDAQRDIFLRENGFIVYRVKWNGINTEKGRKKMESKINNFLDFYNSL